MSGASGGGGGGKGLKLKMPGLMGVMLNSKLALVGLIAASGVWLSDMHPGFELSKQFAGPAFVLAVVGAVLAKAAGRARTLMAFLAAAALLLAPLGPQWLPAAPAAAAGAAPVRIYFANLWVKNERLDDAARSIAEAEPDVIALVEVAETNARASRQLMEDYPYVIGGRGGGPARNMIASRWPLDRVRNRSEDGLAVVEAQVRAPGRPFRLVVVHLTRPWPFTDARAQRSQIDRLVRRIQAGERERIVVVGDFNATLSGDLLQQFREDAALTPAPARLGTWPAMLPGVLRLGIDNVFVGERLTVVNKELGEPNGSDHRPLVFEVAPASRSLDGGFRRFQAGF